MFTLYIAHPDPVAYWVIGLGCAIQEMAGFMMVLNLHNLSREPAGKYLV